jgi:hypothetical protein
LEESFDQEERVCLRPFEGEELLLLMICVGEIKAVWRIDLRRM